MADKLDTRVEGDVILAKHNEIVTVINNGNYGQPFTQDQINAILDSDNTIELIARNTDSGQIEYWFVKDGQKIRRKLG